MRQFSVRLIAILSLLFVLALILFNGCEKRWATGRRLRLGGPGTIDLWFAPGGNLIRLSERDSTVVVESWSPRQIAGNGPGKALRGSVDLARELHLTSVVPRVSWGNVIAGNVVPYAVSNVITTGAGNVVPYAVSGDGTLFGWFWDGELHIRHLGPSAESNGDKIFEIKEVPVRAFIFAGLDKIMMLAGAVGGSQSFEGWDLLENRLTKWSVPVQEDWRIWSRGGDKGDKVAVASLAAGDGFFFPVAEWLRVNIEIMSVGPASVLSVTPRGEVIAGTTTGAVIILGENGAPDVAMPLKGVDKPVRAIAPFQDYFLGAGDFRGAQLLGRNGEQAEMLEGPANIRSLAAQPPYIAYATDNSAEVVEVAEVSHLNETGLLYLTLYSLELGVLSLFAVEGRFVLRAQPSVPCSGPEPEPVPEPGADTPSVSEGENDLKG